MDRPAPSFRRATAWSIAVNAVSQVLSLGFSMLMANFFGAGEATDILYCCIGLVAIAGGIVQVANVNVLIPETMRRRVAAGERDSMAFANRFLALFLAVILVVGLLFLAFSVPLLRAWTRFPPSALAANRPILFWMGLAFPLQLASQLLLDILVSYRFLVLPASLACAGRLVNILFVLFFHARLGVVSVAAGLACGSAAQLACNVWLLFRVVGWRLAWRTEIGSPVWRNLGWAEFGNVVAAAAGYFPVYLFSGIGSGWLTALTYAQRLNGVPTELVTQQVSAAVAVQLNELAAAKRRDDLFRAYERACRLAVAALCPLAALLALLAPDAVDTLFGYGKFQGAPAARTASMFAILAFGIPLWAIMLFNARFLVACQAIRYGVLWQTVSAGMNILAVAAGVRFLGPLGYPVAWVAYIALYTLSITCLSPRRFPGLPSWSIWRRYAATTAGSLGLAWAVHRLRAGPLAGWAPWAGGAACLAVFLLLAGLWYALCPPDRMARDETLAILRSLSGRWLPLRRGGAA